MGYKPIYLSIAVVIFLVEVIIALYVKDEFIRPYGGDYLAVMLLYCLLRSFWPTTAARAAIIILLFSISVETAQYFNIVDKMGLGHLQFARIIIGTSFSWHDIWAYAAGVLCMYIIDIYYIKKIKF